MSCLGILCQIDAISSLFLKVGNVNMDIIMGDFDRMYSFPSSPILPTMNLYNVLKAMLNQ